MAVITVSRQLGSLGTAIAESVARRLGYRVLARDLINQAARRAGAPEVALAMLDDLGLLGYCPSPRDCRAYRKAVGEVMQELAAEGNVVIVGRGGQVILRDRPDVLHVRVIAPVALRAQRISERRHVSRRAALAQVKASDTSHRDYLTQYYRVDWDAPELYDLVVNTAHMDIPAATGVVCAMLEPVLGRGDPVAKEPILESV
ncbi:MAG TPA: cytidylate kinase-like family protein [Anaerolineae bacterium]